MWTIKRCQSVLQSKRDFNGHCWFLAKISRSEVKHFNATYCNIICWAHVVHISLSCCDRLPRILGVNNFTSNMSQHITTREPSACNKLDMTVLWYYVALKCCDHWVSWGIICTSELYLYVMKFNKHKNSWPQIIRTFKEFKKFWVIRSLMAGNDRNYPKSFQFHN